MNDGTDHPHDSAPRGPNPPGGEVPPVGPPPPGTPPPGSQPPPGSEPPPPGRSYRRLVRRRTGRVLAGVCAGLGDYTGIDPVAWRIGFVVASLFGGAGLVGYIACALLIPEEGADASPATRAVRRMGGSWVQWLLIVLGALILLPALFAGVGVLYWRPAFSWAIVLIGLGLLLLRQDNRNAPSPDAPSQPPVTGGDAPASATAPGGPGTRVARVTGGTAAPGATMSNAPPERPAGEAPTEIWPPPNVRPEPRRRSPLVWYTLAATFLGLGAAAVADNLGLVSLQPAQYLSITVLIIGLGLVVGAWWGRSIALIVVGILMLPILLAASLVRLPLEGFVGDRVIRPRTVAALDPSYDMLAGRMTLDLSSIRWPEEPVSTSVKANAGRVEARIPNNVDAVVNGEVTAGTIIVDGDRRSGVRVKERWNLESEANPAEGSLELTIDSGFSEVEVVRVNPRAKTRARASGGRDLSEKRQSLQQQLEENAEEQEALRDQTAEIEAALRQLEDRGQDRQNARERDRSEREERAGGTP
jgi:phage shock protein PspC (stress-responsive transcriptional regulator)